jgi:hypothetical protein
VVFDELGAIRGSVTTMVLPLGDEITCDEELVLVSDPGGRVTMTCCCVPPVWLPGGFATIVEPPDGVVMTRVLLVVLVDDGVLAAPAPVGVAGAPDGSGKMRRVGGPSLMTQLVPSRAIHSGRPSNGDCLSVEGSAAQTGATASRALIMNPRWLNDMGAS